LHIIISYFIILLYDLISLFYITKSEYNTISILVDTLLANFVYVKVAITIIVDIISINYMNF